MNYLAHLFLTRENAEWTFGNFVADFASLQEQDSYRNAFYEGVLIHRKIDTFTDNHKLVRKATRLLHPYFGKYAPVVIDIYFDYFLSKNFHTFYSKGSLQVFCDDIYHKLYRYQTLMPPHLQRILPKMIKSNWLSNYSKIDGIRFTFTKLQARVSFSVNFGIADDVLTKHEEELNLLFIHFFPKVIQEIEAFKAVLKS